MADMKKRCLPDPVSRWWADHLGEIDSYAGQYVAISGRHGIVAHGTDFSKVHEKAVQKDPDAVFRFVPTAGVLVV